MATTFTKIASVTVGSGGAATMDFTSIPSTYTDLVLKVSARSGSTTGTNVAITFNGSSSNVSMRLLYGTGSTAASLSDATKIAWEQSISTYTANTFASADVYIPNYAGSTFKSISFDDTSENNATLAFAELGAGLWSSTAAINQITLTSSSANFVQYTTATLYGINKS
jgi:hypothetical protein